MILRNLQTFEKAGQIMDYIFILNFKLTLYDYKKYIKESLYTTIIAVNMIYIYTNYETFKIKNISI